MSFKPGDVVLLNGEEWVVCMLYKPSSYDPVGSMTLTKNRLFQKVNPLNPVLITKVLNARARFVTISQTNHEVKRERFISVGHKVPETFAQLQDWASERPSSYAFYNENPGKVWGNGTYEIDGDKLTLVAEDWDSSD